MRFAHWPKGSALIRRSVGEVAMGEAEKVDTPLAIPLAVRR